MGGLLPRNKHVVHGNALRSSNFVLYCFAYERSRGRANAVGRGRGQQEAGRSATVQEREILDKCTTSGSLHGLILASASVMREAEGYYRLCESRK